MNRIKTYLNGLGRTARTVILGLAVVFVSAGIAQAATTISTNISTGGLTTTVGFVSQASSTVVGAFRSANASTTQSASVDGPFWVGGNSTTTAAGALSLQSTLGVTGLSTLTGGFVSQASSTVSGDTLLASTTATGFKVGIVGTRVSRIVSGYCVIETAIDVTGNIGSSTAAYANCTPSGGTAVISSSDRVFVQATSSFPQWVVIQAASSTATGGLINVRFTNMSTSTSVASAVYALNFWAFQ